MTGGSLQLCCTGGGEPRPSPSMQHNSNDGRGAHPATEGSRGSAAPEGRAPSDTE